MSTGNLVVSAGTTENVVQNRLVFSDANGVSFGLDGSTITASVAGATAGLGALAAGTQTATSGTIVFSNSNGVSFGLSGSTRITASVDAIKSISGGTTRITGGEAVLSNANGVSFGVDGQTITGSVAAGATATGNLGAVGAGTQTATSGTVIFSDSNGVSFGLSGSTRVTASVDAIKSISAGTTRATGGEVVFSNSNNVSFGLDGQTLTASASYSQSTAPGALAAGTQTATSGTIVFSNSNGVSFGLSGSTRVTATVDAIKSLSAGTTRATGGEVVFSNSNGVTFGLDGQTMTASVAGGAGIGALAAGTQTGTSGTIVFSDSNGISFGLSGSTRVTASVDAIKSLSAGTTRITGGEAVFSNSNGVSFGVDGQTVTGSVAAGATATGNFGALAAGTQTATSGTVVFANSNGISFGMSGSSQVTATLERRVTAFSQWADFATNFSISNATLSLQKLSMPMHLSVTQAVLLMALSGNTDSSGALTVSLGVYTLSGSTASLASSASRQISWTSGSATTASSIYGGVSGTRYRTVAIDISMTPGDYLLGVHMRTTNNGTWRAFGRPAVSIVGTFDGVETAYYLDGTSVSSFTTAMPASIVATNTNYARTGAAAQRQAGFVFVGTF